MIFISITRNYAENRKLRGRLLITRSASRPRNRVLGWALCIGQCPSDAVLFLYCILSVLSFGTIYRDSNCWV